MPEQPTSTPQPQTPPSKYEFLTEFDRRNSLVEAIKFALTNNCNCESCQKLKIFAEVLEEERKAGRIPKLTP